MTRYWLAGAGVLVLVAGAAAQVTEKTQQQLDAQGTQIQVHQSYRSDSTGTSSTLGTEIHRADGSGKAMSEEQRITVAPLPPLPESSSTTTTTTTINRQ
jgi:hypothetical protein